jgi:drug/metabolite transporter (DMT)-like permease
MLTPRSPSTSPASTRAYLLLVAVTLIWAGNFPFGKVALRELGPLTLTAARAVLAAPVLLALARLLHGPLPRLARRDVAAVVVISLTGLVGNTTVWYWGLSYTSPVNAGILGAAAPVAVALAGAVWLRDPLTPRNGAGIALTLAAVTLTVLRGDPAALRTLAVNRGDLIILASQVAWVTYTLYSRATASALPPVTVQAGAHVVSAVVLVPLALLERPWASLPAASWAGWGVVLYAAGPITLGHLWYYHAIRVVGAGRAAVCMNLIPFLVIGLSWLLLGEPVRSYHLARAAGVIGGVALATARR